MTGYNHQTNNLEFASVNTFAASSSASSTNVVLDLMVKQLSLTMISVTVLKSVCIIPGTTDDITVNWQQLNTDNTDHTGVVGANQVVVTPDLSDVDAASGKATLDFDAVNLEFGHTIFEGPMDSSSICWFTIRTY